MHNGASTFVEASNGRLYEVVEVTGYPHDCRGRECRCCVYHAAQRVDLSEHVGVLEGQRLVARALGYALTPAPWRLIRVVGRVGEPR